MKNRQKVVDVCAHTRCHNGRTINVCKHKRSLPL